MYWGISQSSQGNENMDNTPNAQNFEAQGTAVDQAAHETDEIQAPELKENKFIFTLVLIIAALAIICLFVMLFFISKQGANAGSARVVSQSAEKSAGKAGSSGNGTTTEGDIKVVKVTPTVYENAALGEDTLNNTRGSQSAAEKAANYQKEIEKRLNGESAAESPISVTKVTNDTPTTNPGTSSSKTTATDVIVGVDENIAKKNLRAQGFKTYSVYVCDEGALNGSASKPRAGLVLAQSKFIGRSAGEKLAFVNTATSASYSTARTVPNLKGMAWKAARTTLANKGLGIRFEYEDKSPSKYGTVVFQAPAAGTHMPRGCSVIVVLAD